MDPDDPAQPGDFGDKRSSSSGTTRSSIDSLSPSPDDDNGQINFSPLESPPILTPIATESSYSPAQLLYFTSLRKMARRPGLNVGDVMHRDNAVPFPTPAEAKRALGCSSEGVDFALSTSLQGGDTVYVLAMDSYRQVQSYLGESDMQQDVELNNLALFELYESSERPGRTAVGLEEGRDYVLVSEPHWNLLVGWFGGGPSLMRKCVNDKGRIVIDLRGLEFKVKRSSKPTKFLRFVFSKYDTIGQVKRLVVEELHDGYQGDSDPAMYRVWDYFSDKCQQRLHPESSQITAFDLEDMQSIMFEEADPITKQFLWDPETGENLSIPTSTSSSTNAYWTNTTATSSYVRKRAENSVTSTRAPVSRGVVGLANLGNTCFMNSTLQCLNHMWMLRKHFTSDAYLNEVNETNPLGTGGKLAKSFGELMKLMWSDEGDIISPAGFKSQMAEFKPEFSGYQQHDSQELLSFLLDGLHEDLNRIQVKPITNAVEANGRPDNEVAAECRQVHRLRNDSKVNDLFEGFYRSTVVCPDCGKKSITFDPFSVIQLPVSKPQRGGKKLVTQHITILDVDTLLPLVTSVGPITMRVHTDACMYEIRHKIELLANRIVLCSVRGGRIDRILRDTDRLDKPVVEEIVAFAFPDSTLAETFRWEQELMENGTWYRALKTLPGTEGKGPFSTGEVWIGSADQHKMRMRLEVTERSAFGLWKQGAGYLVHCIVDISPVPYGYAEKKEGREEVAYEGVGFLSHLEGENPIQVKFEMINCLGAFGSFTGRYPQLDQNKRYEFSCTWMNSKFVHGLVEEKQQQYASTYTRYSSSYNASQPFALVRVSREDKELPILPLSIGPKPLVSELNVQALYPITLYHRYSYDTVGEPILVMFDRNLTFLSPHDLYDVVVRKLTSRIRQRNTLNRIMESGNDKEDPFGLRQLFTLSVPRQNQIDLSQLDQESNVFALHPSVLSLSITWSTILLGKNVPLYQALFSLLYSEHGNGDASLGRGITLGDCFDLFSEEEKLAPSEAWYCGNCKDHKEAFKRMEIWDLSDLLVIQLKRFSQSPNSYSFDKDDSEVDFPLEGLDLNHRVRGPSGKDGSYVYDLVAVSHHYGGLGGGHYVAHARDELDGSWYELDDSSVRRLGDCDQAATKIRQGSAYVLFYVKRNKTPRSWGPRETAYTPPPPHSSSL